MTGHTRVRTCCTTGERGRHRVWCDLRHYCWLCFDLIPDSEDCVDSGLCMHCLVGPLPGSTA